MKSEATPDVICLTTPSFHSFALANSSWKPPSLTPELVERVLGFLQRERRLYPSLRRDAPDAQARAAELRLALDARDPGPELRGPNGRGVATGPLREQRRRLPSRSIAQIRQFSKAPRQVEKVGVVGDDVDRAGFVVDRTNLRLRDRGA